MTASESSPRKGQEFDGESPAQIVRTLLEQRVDSIDGELNEAFVEARAELRSGGDAEDAMRDLKEELEIAQYRVSDAMSALQGGEE